MVVQHWGVGSERQKGTEKMCALPSLSASAGGRVKRQRVKAKVSVFDPFLSETKRR